MPTCASEPLRKLEEKKLRKLGRKRRETSSETFLGVPDWRVEGHDHRPLGTSLSISGEDVGLLLPFLTHTMLWAQHTPSSRIEIFAQTSVISILTR